jgi:hypothetical protein
VQFTVIEILFLNKAIVLVLEIVIVLEFLLREDFEEFGVDGVGVTEGLDCRERSQVVEIVVCRREKGCSKGLDGDFLGGFGRGCFAVFAFECAKCFEDILI